MKIMDTVRLYNLFDGKDLSSLLDDNADCKAENEIKAKITSLNDERNTHNQRISAIDAEIAKLEAELSILAEQRITELEAEYSQCEERMQSIKSQLEQLKATPATT